MQKKTALAFLLAMISWQAACQVCNGEGLPPAYQKIQLAVTQSKGGDVVGACHTLGEVFPEVEQQHLADSACFAEGLNVWARCLLRQADLPGASRAVHRALGIRQALFEPNSYPIMQSLNALGVVLDQAGDLDSALLVKLAAFEIGLKVLGEGHEEMLVSYNNLAGTFNNLNRFEEALDMAQRGLEYAQRLTPVPKPYGMGHLHNSLAVAYDGLGDFRKGLAHKQIALDYWLASAGPYSSDVGLARLNLGTSHYYLGQYRQAIECLESALEVFDSTLAKTHPYVGAALNNLGAMCEAIQDYGRAALYLARGLRLRELVLPPNHLDIGQSCHNLAVLKSKLGQTEAALPLYRRALDIYGEVLDEESPLYQSTLVSMADGLIEIGRFKEAEQLLLPARKKLQKLVGPDHLSCSDLDMVLGSLYQREGKWGLAQQAYEQALKVRLTLFDAYHTDVANTYNSLGELCLEQGKPSRAISFFEKALPPHSAQAATGYKSTITVQENHRSLSGLGRAYAAVSHDPASNEKALTLLNQAMGLLEQGRADFQFADSKLQLSKLAQPTIAAAIALLYPKANELPEAKAQLFDWMERGKAMILLEAIRKVNAPAFSGLPDSLLALELQLKVEIYDAELAILEESRKGQHAKADVLYERQEQLAELYQAYELCRAELAHLSPAYYQAKYAARRIGLAEVQHRLLKPGQGLLEFFFAEQVVYLCLITSDEVKFHKIRLDFPLVEWVQQIRGALKQPHPHTLRAYAGASHQLYNKLIAPIGALPDRLVVVSDGVLNELPFDLLLSSTPENLNQPQTYPYLFREQAISYSYSATLLQEMASPKLAKAPQKAVLAMAPFADVLPPMAGSPKMGSDWSALPFTKTEVDSLRTWFPTLPLYGAQATKEQFVALASQYAVLHLPTHGKIGLQAEEAFLAFAPQAEGRGQERLHLKALYNIPLRAELAMLPACDTHAGLQLPGEGLISLARAFAYAGAQSVAASLWAGDDLGLQSTTLAFYANLRDGLPKDQALQQAKSEVVNKRQGLAAHPFYWGSLVLIGDTDPLEFINRPSNGNGRR